MLLVGRRGGVAHDLVERAGIRLETLDIQGLQLSNPVSVATFALRLPRAIRQARRLIRDFKADVVIGAAGYVCVPVVLAAGREGVPVLLMEQNAVPGRAVRLLARRARAVAVSFPQTVARLRGARCVVTGNPIRAGFTREQPPLGESCSRLLVMGGSQGARRINRAVAGALSSLLAQHPDLVVTHQCGRLDEAEMLALRERLDPAVRERWRVAAFYSDMAAQVRDCDLVLMRAGGSSLAEVSALGRPMVLVPYPHAGGHQRFNAGPYVEGGAALLIPDDECTPQRVATVIGGLLDDAPRWRGMAARSRELARPDATAAVVSLVRETAGRKAA